MTDQPTFRWTRYGADGSKWAVSKRGIGWRLLEGFEEKDPVAGRKRCEAIIAANVTPPTVTFYYDRYGKQLEGFKLS